jgi:hypothetical protein
MMNRPYRIDIKSSGKLYGSNADGAPPIMIMAFALPSSSAWEETAYAFFGLP